MKRKRQERRRGERHALLWTACALMGALLVCDCLVALFMLAMLVPNTATPALLNVLWSDPSVASSSGARNVLAIDIVANAICVVLEAVCIARAISVVRMHESDTHDHVAQSQLLTIALIGLTIVEWSVLSLAIGGIRPLGFTALALSLVPCVVYYRAIARESHSPLWQGIRNAAADMELVDASMLPKELALDAQSGMLVAATTPGAHRVRICTLADFTNSKLDGNLVQRAEHSLAHARRTAVYPLGESILGTLFVPQEKLNMTGPAIGGEAHLGFHLTRNELTLVADDEPTRRLLAWYLTEQYLAKQEPGEVVIELQELLIDKDPDALAELDDRIDELEDSLSEGIGEIPRDFSDYVNDTRHDLGVMMKFYRQVSDAADDSLADGVIVSKRTRRLLAGLNRRSTTLASDAAELRDYLNQVREGYQERINVRQNGIMSILTIVTSLATPITVLTSWYGMNFAHMPELQWTGAYNVVIIVAVIIVTLEVLYFKRKRWF